MLDKLRSYGMVYLASPYSKYRLGIEVAFKDVSWVAGRLLKEGVKVYSPIAHTHPLAIYGELDPFDHSIWLPFDEVIMSRSDALVVAKMPGWETSYGVKHEIEFFQKAGKPIHYINWMTLRLEGEDAPKMLPQHILHYA